MNSGASFRLEIQGVTFGYAPDTPVLSGVTLAAAPRELVCLLGRNGSGKTTLLRCILRLLIPQTGTILLNGRDWRRFSPRALAREVAYVPQSATPAFSFTAGEVVVMGRLAHTGALGLPGPSDMAVAQEAMRMTRTLHLARRPFNALSGGEAQCVMIARALAQQPHIMLLDEPTSHLDLANQLMIYEMLRRVAHEWPMAVLCISHDINLAARFADRLVLLRRGRIVADGPPPRVLKADLLEETFDVRVALVPGPEGGPLVWATSRRT